MYSYSDRFLKSIPKDLKEKVLIKCHSFYEDLIKNNYNIYNVRKGYWTRIIKGTNPPIYKFRLNSGDRILYSYTNDFYNLDKETASDNICFIEYCIHDNQIKEGKKIKRLDSIEIDKSPLEDDKIIISSKNNYSDKIVYSNLDFINNNVIDYEKYLNILITNSDDYYLYYLNSYQKKVLQSSEKGACLLSGTAGSGKTTISIYKTLSVVGMSKGKVLYITLTSNLKDKVNGIFKAICKNEYLNKVNILDFNSLCIELLNTDQYKKIIKFKDFKEWLENLSVKDAKFKNRLNKLLKDYKPFDVYCEIRGNIKGGMGLNYNRCSYIHSLNVLKKDEYLSKEYKYTYMDLYNRETVYTLSQKYYDIWLKENFFLDDNDICFLILNKLENNDIKKWDYVIIDEAQDFTDFQLYILVNLVKDKNNIFILGDVQQLIHHTFFTTSRIKSLFYLYGIDNDCKHLNINYRNQKQIIELSNYINKYKKEILGLYDLNESQIYEKGVFEGNKPIACAFKDVDLNNLLSESAYKSYVVILVSNEKEKENLLKVNEELNIFTIDEYKGLEDRYVICYNLLSSFNEEYEKIFNSESLIKSYSKQRYRYFFNLIYVAITRAKENLCFVELKCLYILKDKFKDFFDFRDKFDKKLFYMDEDSSKNEYIKNGFKYELNENYYQAANNFKKANSKADYNRSMAKYYLSKKEYEEAFKYLEKINQNNFKEPIEETKDQLIMKIVKHISDLNKQLEIMSELAEPCKYFYKIIDKKQLDYILENKQINKDKEIKLILEILNNQTQKSIEKILNSVDEINVVTEMMALGK